MQKFLGLALISILSVACSDAANNTPGNNGFLSGNDDDQPDTTRKPSAPRPVDIKAIKYTRVIDPLEKSFSLNMPVGWKNEAYISRSYTLYKSVATSVSPDSRTVLYIGDAKLPFYTAPSEMVNAYMNLVTSNPLMKVSYYTPAEQYFTNYLQEKFGSLKGFRILSKTTAPALEEIIYNIMAKNNFSASITSACIKFQYMADDKVMNCMINGATINLGASWFTDLSGIATLDKVEDYNETLLTMVKSHITDPGWKAREQQQHEQRMAKLRMDYANQQVAFSAMNEQHRIRMQNMQASHDAHNQNWASQQASIDRNHERFLNVIRGEHTVSVGSGNTYQVDNSHQKYFVNKHTNKYIGTYSTTSIDDLRRLQGVNPDDYEEAKIIR